MLKRYLIILFFISPAVIAQDKIIVCEGQSRLHSTDYQRETKTYNLSSLETNTLCRMTDAEIRCETGNLETVNNRSKDGFYSDLKLDRYSGAVTDVRFWVSGSEMAFYEFTGSCRAGRKRF